MAHTTTTQQDASAGSQRIWCGAVLALLGSLALMLLITSAAVPSAIYWALSSIALIATLTVFVLGERAWDRMVANARAAGVVARTRPSQTPN